MTAKVLLVCIRAYQLTLSPFFGGWCRFEPSCSVYASEAIRMHGAARGSWLAIKRLAKCHPLGSHGFDPVPSASSFGHRGSPIGHRSSDIGHRSSDIGHRPSVIGHRH